LVNLKALVTLQEKHTGIVTIFMQTDINSMKDVPRMIWSFLISIVVFPRSRKLPERPYRTYINVEVNIIQGEIFNSSLTLPQYQKDEGLLHRCREAVMAALGSQT
jgi:hypothetical protein